MVTQSPLEAVRWRRSETPPPSRQGQDKSGQGTRAGALTEISNGVWNKWDCRPACRAHDPLGRAGRQWVPTPHDRFPPPSKTNYPKSSICDGRRAADDADRVLRLKRVDGAVLLLGEVGELLERLGELAPLAADLRHDIGDCPLHQNASD